jgi:exodeoxyribonuclease V alpha subunit
LADAILEKTSVVRTGFDDALLADGLRRFFPSDGNDGCDWQKVAAVAALRKNFCVISGGPGTGKTSTVVKIIALLLELARGGQLRIALAAPTGKAAARLNESIRSLKENLDCAREIKDRIPEEVCTIHRLLGSKGNSGKFNFSQENRLPFDVVIVDEASMVALPLMAKLAVALKKDSHLILLGDKDQLASVEAGAVLGDICGVGGLEPFTPEFCDYVARVSGEHIPSILPGIQLPPLADSMVVLKTNYRFSAYSGIGALGIAVNSGEGGVAIAILSDASTPNVNWRNVPAPDMLKRELVETILEGFSTYLMAKSPIEALKAFDGFRVLCALRKGPHGVAAANGYIEEILSENGLIKINNECYHGRPVMITVNDYDLQLYNGDIGVIFVDPKDGGVPRVYFPASDGALRCISPVRLPAHETVYAMTIHKSQGSEFERILFLLPSTDTEILTRELIYTGITRAKSAVDIWGNEDVFINAVSRRVERDSGLKAALWI